MIIARSSLVTAVVFTAVALQCVYCQPLSLLHIDSTDECFGPKPVFTPSGDTVVILDCANKMLLWPIGGEKTEVEADSSWEVHEVMAFSPDGAHAFSAGITGWLWDVSLWEELTYDPRAYPYRSLYYLSDGSRLIGETGRDIHLIDAETGQSVRTIGPSGFYFSTVAISGDDSSVIAGFADRGTLARFNIATGAFSTFAIFNGETYKMVISPDGQRLMVWRTLREGTVNEHQIVEYDALTGSFVRYIDSTIGRLGRTVYDIDYSPDGRYIILAFGDEAPIVYDATTLERLGSIGTRAATRIEISRDSRRILVVAPLTIDVWEFVITGSVANAVTGPSKAMIESVAPNPAQVGTKVVFTMPYAGGVDLQLIDIHGDVVWRGGHTSYPIGSNVVQLNFTSIPVGTYRLLLVMEGGISSFPLVIIR